MAETRFEGSSPVARYWLTRCEGFAVRGGSTGVVESLIREADPYETAWIVVRTRARRRQAVPVDAIASVDPAERVVVVEKEEREPRVGPAVRAAGAAVAPRARSGAQAARAATTTTARAIAPRAQSGAHAVQTATTTTMRALGPGLAAARAAAGALLHGIALTFVQSFRSLLAEARYPKPYVPPNRSASRRTSSDAGSPTTFR
jgi:hypothetical protein